MAEKKNKTIEKARVEMEYLTGDEELKRLAELREKWAMDYDSGISDAREEGRTDGIKIAQKRMIKKLLKIKMPLEDIEKVSELSMEEILKIKEEINQEENIDN